MSIVVEIAERRRTLRADVRIPAYVQEISEEGAFDGDEEVLLPSDAEILNLSENGLLIEATDAVRPGRVVRVSFHTSRGEIDVFGRVRRTRCADYDRAVFAVSFRNLDPRTKSQLRRIVRKNRSEPALN